MEEADNTFALNTVITEKKTYKCDKGHVFETDGFCAPFHFTVWQGNKSLGTTNYLCGECIIDWANSSFTLSKVESDG